MKKEVDLQYDLFLKWMQMAHDILNLEIEFSLHERRIERMMIAITIIQVVIPIIATLMLIFIPYWLKL